MKKSRVFLIITVVLAIIAGAVVMVSKGNAKNSQNILKDESTTATEGNIPVLHIFSGEVEVKLVGEDYVDGIEGQKIPQGTSVKTDKDGRAQIKYPNNSVTRIDHNSEITLDKFENGGSQTNVKILIGRIWNRVAKLLGSNEEFSSSTETLVASVRGTSYGHGILTDGNNKISVSRSHVVVECNSNESTIDIQTNKKITTKCTNTLSTQSWGQEEKNDEWFNWNEEEDKKLDIEFGLSTYDDLPSPTPTATPKLTPKPTVKGTSTIVPSPTPTATSTPTPTSTPTATATPTPGFSISNVYVSCSNNAGRSQTPPCGDSGYSLAISITGSGFNQSQNPGVNLIKQSGSGSDLSTSDISFDGPTYAFAKFSTTYTGTYEVHYIQNNQDVKYNETITLP